MRKYYSKTKTALIYLKPKDKDGFYILSVDDKDSAQDLIVKKNELKAIYKLLGRKLKK